MPAKTDKRAGINFTNVKPSAQPFQQNAAAQAARPVMTEHSRKAAAAAVAVQASRGGSMAPVPKMLQAEQPVKLGVKKGESPALKPVIGQARVPALKDRIAGMVARTTPEKPVHGHLAGGPGPAKGPASAEHNRRLKKNFAIKRATPETKVTLSAGISPADFANGLTTPERGLVTVHTLPFPTGTPQAIREATPEAAKRALEASDQPILTLPTTYVVDDPKNDPRAAELSGDGVGRIAFLAGAVFVAWLLLKGGA